MLVILIKLKKNYYRVKPIICRNFKQIKIKCKTIKY